MSLKRLYRRHAHPADAATHLRDWRSPSALLPDAMAWLRFYQGLDQGHWDLRVEDAQGPLFEAWPAPTGEGRPGTDAPKSFHLSPQAFVRRLEDGIWLESPVAPSRIRILRLELMYPLLSDGLQDGIPNEAEAAFLKALQSAGFGLEAREDDPSLDFWEFHDRVACASSYPGPLAGALGGTFRFRGHRNPLPLLSPPGPGRRIPLPLPDPEAQARLSIPLQEVLDQRRSIRRYASPPPNISDLGALLQAAARVQSRIQGPEGLELSHRPWPSGGSLHPIEILPAVRDCPGLNPGLYRYDPVTHELEELQVEAAAWEILMDWSGLGKQDSGFDPVPVLLLLSARFGRTAWKYQGFAYRLIQTDLGCLEQTLYLTATALGLAPCALGGADPQWLEKATGISRWVEPLLGAFALGRAEPSQPV